MFGTTKGAFTGAMNKAGLFEMAQGGTLFLDELLAMPIHLQAKLLRVLQEKKVRRLGSPNEIDVDVKIISAVSRDPRLAIQREQLRIDLYYRLGVVPHQYSTPSESPGRDGRADHPFYRKTQPGAGHPCQADIFGGDGALYGLPLAGQCPRIRAPHGGGHESGGSRQDH